MKLHKYVITDVQTMLNKIGADDMSKNHTIMTVTHEEELYNVTNIPPFMKDYFKWHGVQLHRMKEDCKRSEVDGTKSDENDNYLSKYRFLVLRCAAGKSNGRTIEDRCGGLSDRLKTFPLFIWYAATTDRILFIRWGKNRPAPIETFLVPGKFWNWTFPDELLMKIERLESAAGSINHDGNFSRLYFDGLSIQHKQMLNKISDQTIWMVEGNDFTGGRTRYKNFVDNAIKTASTSMVDQVSALSETFSASTLRPEDSLYETFYHDLFHMTFRPSSGVERLLDSYFYIPEDEYSSTIRSWLPVPLKRNQYSVAQYRASYPKEPYRETQNRTILQETTIHAVECAKSRVSSTKSLRDPRKISNTSALAEGVSAVYVASDTGK